MRRPSPSGIGSSSPGAGVYPFFPSGGVSPWLSSGIPVPRLVRPRRCVVTLAIGMGPIMRGLSPPWSLGVRWAALGISSAMPLVYSGAIVACADCGFGPRIVWVFGRRVWSLFGFGAGCCGALWPVGRWRLVGCRVSLWAPFFRLARSVALGPPLGDFRYVGGWSSRRPLMFSASLGPSAPARWGLAPPRLPGPLPALARAGSSPRFRVVSGAPGGVAFVSRPWGPPWPVSWGGSRLAPPRWPSSLFRRVRGGPLAGGLPGNPTALYLSRREADATHYRSLGGGRRGAGWLPFVSRTSRDGGCMIAKARAIPSAMVVMMMDAILMVRCKAACGLRCPQSGQQSAMDAKGAPAFSAADEIKTHEGYDCRNTHLARSFHDTAPIQAPSKRTCQFFLPAKCQPSKSAAKPSLIRATRDGQRRPRWGPFWRRKTGRDPSTSKSLTPAIDLPPIARRIALPSGCWASSTTMIALRRALAG